MNEKNENASNSTATEVLVESEASRAVTLVELALSSSSGQTENLSPGIWAVLVFKLLFEIKSSLHYFHQFMEIEDYIRRKILNSMLSIPNDIILTFPEGITKKTRVIWITTWLNKRMSQSGENKKPGVTEWTLLTDSGKMLIASFENIGNSWENPHQIDFKEVTEEQLAEIIEQHYFTPTDIVDRLQEIIIFGIEKREKQLAQIKTAHVLINRMKNFIKH